MYGTLLVAPLAALILSACVVAPPDHGHRMVIAPVLPSIVILRAEPYFYQSGYHYHYDNNRWRYSKSRSGPWTDLPRSHYPKETKYKGHNIDRDGRRDDARDDKRDGRRDDRRSDDRDDDHRSRR